MSQPEPAPNAPAVALEVAPAVAPAAAPADAPPDPQPKPAGFVRTRLRALRARVAEYGKLLLASNRSPWQISLAIVLGAIIGCLPLTGVQLLLCIGLAKVLRLNLPIMYGAANISIPPIVPFIGWASVQIGERILHGRFLELSRDYFLHTPIGPLIKRFFIAWMLGGTIFGAAVGVIMAAVVWVLLYRRRRAAASAEPLSVADTLIQGAVARAAKHYDRALPRFRYYARAKYRMDPCYQALCARIPEGKEVDDLGCGLGMLGVALAELGGRRTWGVDWDAEKIAAGKQAAAELPAGVLTLTQGDLRTTELPPCDVVTLIDVLHYYDAPTQALVLARAAAALRPGGQLLVRETDPERAGGARLTRFFERAMVRLGWNRGPRVYYRPIPELDRDLRELGLTTEQLEVAGTTHPGNILLAATKT